MSAESSALARLEREVRNLRIYAIFLSAGICILGIAAFTQPVARRGRYEVLDVERLNVVSKNGKYAVVISSPAQMPGNVMGGKEYPRTDSRGGGLLFYNRDGDEAGGLIFDNSKGDTTSSAFGQLSLDRYGSDQVAVLKYYEGPDGWWSAGLDVSHYPRGGLFEFFNARDSLDRLPPSARDSAIQQLRRRFFREGKGEIKRMFAGEEGRNAIVRLNDTRGRPRVRLIVDSLDVARLEFLDSTGKVIQRLPNQE